MKLKGISVCLILFFALIAVIPPVSAMYSITTDSVSCNGGITTWIMMVGSDSAQDNDISNWIVFWCDKDAIKEVWVGTEDLTGKYGQDPGWEYMDKPDHNLGLKGIKIQYPVGKGTSVKVTIKLEGCGYDTSDQVKWGIKTGNGIKKYGTLWGPICPPDPIPEFATIAIPVAVILGLLFFFNHRKQRKS